jgi:hypothetical protein
MVDIAATAHMGGIGAGFALHLHLQQDNPRRKMSMWTVCPPACLLSTRVL